jgi:hypothetical protein
VLYLCLSCTPLTVKVDSKPIVFKPGRFETIEVENPPVEQPKDQPKTRRPPNMDHFEKFYRLVDAQEKPKPIHERLGVVTVGPESVVTVEPDYCPPWRI